MIYLLFPQTVNQKPDDEIIKLKVNRIKYLTKTLAIANKKFFLDSSSLIISLKFSKLLVLMLAKITKFTLNTKSYGCISPVDIVVRN